VVRRRRREEGKRKIERKLSMGPSKWPSCYTCCLQNELRGVSPAAPFAPAKSNQHDPTARTSHTCQITVQVLLYIPADQATVSSVAP
jgi:hypothetical protein